MELDGSEIRMDERAIPKLIIRNKWSGTEYVFWAGSNGWIEIMAENYEAEFYDMAMELKVCKGSEVRKRLRWGDVV